MGQPMPGTPLTPQEKSVLAFHAQGLGATEVAVRMGLTVDTVKVHSRRARLRLGARNTTHAVALAIGTRQITAGVALPPDANTAARRALAEGGERRG